MKQLALMIGLIAVLGFGTFCAAAPGEYILHLSILREFGLLSTLPALFLVGISDRIFNWTSNMFDGTVMLYFPLICLPLNFLFWCGCYKMVRSIAPNGRLRQ